MTAPGRGRRGVARLAAVAVAFAALFCGLGVWQIERRTWKLDLIARVEARVHASPERAPGPAAWDSVSAAADEYRHVAVTGRFLPGHDTLVQAVTTFGAGYWVLAPFRTEDGATVLVNRGFVPSDARHSDVWHTAPGAEPETVTGLLRLPEPGGAFLRTNDPAADRWFSRDVAAIAAARGLGPVAPYFIDADARAGPAGSPRGGLTAVRFPNNHLVYALTWFALAALSLAAVAALLRERNRPRPAT